jgi:hypothetical protein
VLGAIGCALLLVAVAAPATSLAQDATPADLTATPAGMTVTILAHHAAQPVSVAITASGAIPPSDTLGGAILGDLVRDDSAARIPRSALQVAVSRDANDSSNETFVLTITPDLSGVDPGMYSGNVRVSGPGVNPLVVPVTLSIQGGWWLGVLALLLLGLLVGWVLKWYADAGSKLATETRRYNAVLRKIGDTPTSNLPKFVLDELGDVTQGFNDADQAKVDVALTLLEAQVTGLAAVTDAVAHLRDSIQAHTDEIGQQGLALPRIPENERRRLNDALNEAGDLDTAKTPLTDLLTHADAITRCLQRAADPAVAAVLAAYDQDRFADALNAFHNLPAPPAPAPPGGGVAMVPVGGCSIPLVGSSSAA